MFQFFTKAMHSKMYLVKKDPKKGDFGNQKSRFIVKYYILKNSFYNKFLVTRTSGSPKTCVTGGSPVYPKLFEIYF